MEHSNDDISSLVGIHTSISSSFPSLSPTINPENVSSLTDAQDKALSLLPIFSGLLSAWGSANIIYMVLKASHKSSYQRIMLGLSVFDLISSLALSLQAFLLPANTSQRIWAIGTDATCTAMGFFQQLSTANVWYNGFLSVFFLLTIRYNVSNQTMSRWIEPVFHIIAIGHPLLTAIVGAAIGAYGELDVGHHCWLTDYPEGCTSCQEGKPEGENVVCCQTPLLAYLFAAIPSFLVLIAVIVNNLLIYCHLRRQARIDKNNANSPEAGSTDSAVSNLASSAAPAPLENTSSHSRVITNVGQVQEQERRTQQRKEHEQELNQQRAQKRLQAAAVQAFLYVAAFLATQLPLIIMGIMATGEELTPANDHELFPIMVLRAILWPLQGLFNYLIYIRPDAVYLREIM